MADKPKKYPGPGPRPRQNSLMNRDGTFGPKPKPRKPKPKPKKGGQQLIEDSRKGGLQKRANKALEKLWHQEQIRKMWDMRRPRRGEPTIASFGSVSNGPRTPGRGNPRI